MSSRLVSSSRFALLRVGDREQPDMHAVGAILCVDVFEERI